MRRIQGLYQIVYQWIAPNLSRFYHDRQGLVWFLALCIGLGVGIAAIMFRELIGIIQWTWLGTTSEKMLDAALARPWYVLLCAPIIGGAIVGWLLMLLTARRAAGVADVIEARALSGDKLPLRDGLISSLLTAVSLGFGASAGREGPVIHLGATLSRALSERFQLTGWCQRTLLASGVASAIAASFNAPIAGVLFAHEVILGHYATRSFVPIVIASTSGGLISRLWFGEAAAFFVPTYEITSYWEFPAFALLGVVAALVAIIFQFSLFSADYIGRNIKIRIWMRPILGGLMVGIIATQFPHIMGVGYDITDRALWNQLPLSLMLILIVMKILATAITLASRFGGGIFSPALYLGALTGGSFGIIATSIVPEFASSVGLYAILGMGAVAAATLGAPISTTLIVFELTGGYALSVALLLTCAIAHGINHAVHGHSYFQWQLEMRGLFIHDGPHRTVTATTRVMDFMDVKKPDEEAEYFDRESETPTLKPTDTLELSLRVFNSSGRARLPVLAESGDDTIIAWVSHVKALRYFNRALVDASEEEHR